MKNKRDFRIFDNKKRGWIRIVEAFVAILLIAGIVLTVLGSGYIKGEDESSKIYDAEIALLREVQNTDSLRNDVLSASGTLPLENSEIPTSISSKIQADLPKHLECTSMICELGDACVLTIPSSGDLYARAALIGGEQETRQLKIFCWKI
jgi:hypothetical protein